MKQSEEDSINRKDSDTVPEEVCARALANLALVKYFGKRDLALNLPATGSLSLTLEPLSTVTKVSFSPDFERDEVILDKAPADERFQRRISRFLDIVRSLAKTRLFAHVVTHNDFPTAAGLASSASGFAALALAATRALHLELDPCELSTLARRGSGSAARSIAGGIAVWHAGALADGSDSYADSIAEPEEWDLRVVVGVTDVGPKAMGSTEAMESTRLTSPYYQSWIAATHNDLEQAIEAVHKRDFSRLGEITEQSALSMHAAALAARPGIAFWNGATVDALHAVRRLRNKGHSVYFTCDAGPQPKVLCQKNDEEKVVQTLEALPGIRAILRCHLGKGAAIVNRSISCCS